MFDLFKFILACFSNINELIKKQRNIENARLEKRRFSKVFMRLRHLLIEIKITLLINISHLNDRF